MRAIPAVRAARSGLSGRRVQAIVIGLVVLVSTAASTLALGLLVDSNAPFDHAFAKQNGADVTAAVSTGKVTSAQLAATAKLSGVTAAAGPFPETTVNAQVNFAGGPGPIQGPSGPIPTQLTLVGRSSPGGPVDDLTPESGHWAQGPGQIVWADNQQGLTPPLGAQITVTGAPGSPKLTVVGIATSITGTAQGWVTPGEISALYTVGRPEAWQMLYRFSNAGSDAAVNADIASIRAALPHGSLLGAQSYLAAKLKATSSIAPWVPFIVAFGLLGLVMSVLIVANVVSGAVVAGTRRIGVLKSIGFSPAQVVASYVLQVAVPALAGCVVGVVVGNLLSVPLLGQTAEVYGVGTLAIPLWVDLVVPLAMLGLAGVAALLIALHAGRMSAVQAIATGRAPRAAHGYGAHRLLGRARLLPRPATIGLAGPFARPTRTAITLAAILFGVIAVTFAVGLGTSLDRVQADLSHAATEPVQVALPGPHAGPGGAESAGPPGARLPSLAAQERAVQAALRAQPGTLHYVAEADDQISVLGLSGRVSLIAFDGDASWTGYGIIVGHWYSGTNQVDVNTAFLTQTGTSVGDTYTLTSGAEHVTVQIAGEIFDPAGGRPEIIGGLSTLSGVDPGLTVGQYDVALKPGVNAQSYTNAVQNELGQNYAVAVNARSSSQFVVIVGLIATLTLLLMAVAGLGVLNTVVLQTRERVHDLGVFKAVGMTPRQTIAMVVCSVAGIGLVAGLVAIPAGIALHRYVLPIMGRAAQTGLPSSVLNVYQAPELILLALSGLVIAVAGAMIPAGWAARTRTASALRAE
jgi:putative ABC transport system permease protein